MNEALPKLAKSTRCTHANPPFTPFSRGAASVRFPSQYIRCKFFYNYISIYRRKTQIARQAPSAAAHALPSPSVQPPKCTAQGLQDDTRSLQTAVSNPLGRFHKAFYIIILHIPYICILMHQLCKYTAQTALFGLFALYFTFILYYAICTICRTCRGAKCRAYILYFLLLSSDMRKSMDASGGHRSHASSASSASFSSVGSPIPRSLARFKAQ